MRRRCALALAILLATGSATGLHAQGTAGGSPPNIRPGTPYARAHSAMIAAGYKPYRVLDPKSDIYNRNIFSRGDIYKAYPEVNACAGTGAADCEFIFAKGPSDIVAIHTTGEEVRSLTVHDVRHLTQAQADKMY